MINKKIFSLILSIFLVSVILVAAAPDMYQIVPETSYSIQLNETQESNNDTIITATIKIVPQTLNLKSKGKWIMCMISLPKGYNVSEINVSSVRLNENVTPDLSKELESEPPEGNTTAIDEDNDENETSTIKLKLKFSRAAVMAILTPGNAVIITVTGKLYDNTSFAGNDTIRIIKPPVLKFNNSKKNNNGNAGGTGGTGKHDYNNDTSNEENNDYNNDTFSFNGSNNYNNQSNQQSNSSNLTAKIKIVPVSINLKSEGNWITCFIELSDGYNVSDINASSVRLNGTLEPVLDPKYGFVSNESEYITDEDDDGNLERMFKFDRAQVQTLFSKVEDKTWVEIIITGEVNGIDFEGSDTVKIINK